MSAPPSDRFPDNFKLLPRRVLIGALAADFILVVMYALTVGLKKTPTGKPLIFLFGLGFAMLAFGGTVIETLGNYLPAASIQRLVEVGVEESIEMFGATVMLYSATRVLAQAGARLLPPSVTAPAPAK